MLIIEWSQPMSPNESVIPSRKTNLPDFWQLLSMLFLIERPLGWLSLAIFLGTATVLCGIGLIGSSTYLISAAALIPSIAALQVAIVGVRFFGLGRGVFRYLERVVNHSVNFRILARLRVWFYERIEPLAPAMLVHRHSGDLLNQFVSDIDTLENFYVRAVSPPLVALAILLAMGFFLGTYNFALMIALAAFTLSEGMVLPVLVNLISQGAGRDFIDQRASLATFLVDGIQGLPDILAFNREGESLLILKKLESRFAQSQRKLGWIGGLQIALTGLLSDLGTWCIFAIGIFLMSIGKLDGISLAVLVLAVSASFEGVSSLPQAAQNLGSSLEAFHRLKQATDEIPAVVDSTNIETELVNYQLVVRQLGFRYETNGFRLKDISFCLEPGEHIAIVGTNAAGKTTLVNLLLRFWEYQDGGIFLGGHNLRNYSLEDVRRWVGLISSSPYLFDTTIRRNLLLADPKASPNRLDEVISQAQLKPFVAGLPNGLDTWVGEHGLRLSAGERQRLGIARTLLQDAPIMLIDEPTSNLDPVTAQEITSLLFEAGKQKSMLWITHHLAGLEKFDLILVMQDGQIIEQGSHLELWQAGGFYRHLWEMQRENFAESRL